MQPMQRSLFIAFSFGSTLNLSEIPPKQHIAIVHSPQYSSSINILRRIPLLDHIIGELIAMFEALNIVPTNSKLGQLGDCLVFS